MKTKEDFLEIAAKEFNHTNSTINSWADMLKAYHPNDILKATLRAMDLFAQQEVEKNIPNEILSNDKVWVENNECPKCKSKNIKWHLSSTKQCNDCNNIFRAEELV